MSYSRLQQSFTEPRGHSSAVASVLYSKGSNVCEVTKSGSYVYHGDASTYHEWEFRTRLRVKAAGDDPEKYAEAMSKVVDGLRGDAFIIAKEVGLDKLWEVGDAFVDAGVDTLIKAIKESVFPLTTYEAKELFRQYCKPAGSLSRQNGESMHQFVSRRRRCWKLLKELDPEIELSEGHRADMLLDLAGLDANSRTMIQASIGNARDFDKIADALQVQHPRIHLKNVAPTKPKGSSKGKSYTARFTKVESSGRANGHRSHDPMLTLRPKLTGGKMRLLSSPMKSRSTTLPMTSGMKMTPRPTTSKRHRLDSIYRLKS